MQTVTCIVSTQFLTFILINYNWMLLNTPFPYQKWFPFPL